MNARWELVSKATEFVAEEMGIALKRSALSPNIRERMDHSCAVLTSTGEIVAQAEHIPVHLGSFRVGTRNLLGWIEHSEMALQADDMVLVNDPYISGTHLNDLMLLAPVFYRGALRAYVVSKAHIVDVGGPTPGSLNPLARTLYEEGLIIPPTKLVDAGSTSKAVTDLLAANFKDPGTGLGDVRAEVAANRMGTQRVAQLFDRFGQRHVAACWRDAIDHTRATVEEEISKLKRGRYTAEDHMEWNGEKLPIRLTLTIGSCGVVADFAGSHAQILGPLNAVLGVTFSAAAFAVRSIIESPVATNEGFYGSVDVHAPLGSLLNPVSPAPVSGGNVETTQRVADVMFLALSQVVGDRVPAASAGTMMNVMLGGENPGHSYWAYYETIGGGSGARPGGNGISGVHTNMTNTLNTPVEIAEIEYPLLYTRYQIRRRSGGKGRWVGGDGIIRAFRALRPTTLSILSDRFEGGPWGLRGGDPGAPGRISITGSGSAGTLPSKFVRALATGDEVVLETPGGGGFGRAGASRRRSGTARPTKPGRKP